MPILDLITLCPPAEPVLKEWGLHCTGCMGSTVETIGDGARSHGFSDDDIETLLQDIRDAAENMEARPQFITITKSAAEGLGSVARDQGKADHALLITVDGTGGFCLDFLEVAPSDAHVFMHREVPDVKIYASSLTLQRIGGATIDHRDGRFKLDLPEDSGCACGGSCSCK